MAAEAAESAAGAGGRGGGGAAGSGERDAEDARLLCALALALESRPSKWCRGAGEG